MIVSVGVLGDVHLVYGGGGVIRLLEGAAGKAAGARDRINVV